MNKALMDKWLEDLTTTDKGQAKNALRTSDGRYCCLGRADEVCFGATFTKNYDVMVDDQGFDTHLSPERAEELGLDKLVTGEERVKINTVADLLDPIGDMPNIIYEGQVRQQALAGLNDGGLSFKQIATVVRNLGWDKEE